MHKTLRGPKEEHCTNPMFVKSNTQNINYWIRQTQACNKLYRSQGNSTAQTRCLGGKTRKIKLLTKTQQKRATNFTGGEGKALHKPGVVRQSTKKTHGIKQNTSAQQNFTGHREKSTAQTPITPTQITPLTDKTKVKHKRVKAGSRGKGITQTGNIAAKDIRG